MEELRFNPRKEIEEDIRENNLQDLLIKSAVLHGHFCIGLSLGVRAALYATKKLNSITENVQGVGQHLTKRLIAIVETNTCFADGVQMVAGTTLGNGGLIYRDTGKHVLTLIDRNTSKAVRVSLKVDPHTIIKTAN
ncbi:formylmethanofuran dehydrogenase, partial [Sulfolobus sp. A20-N-F6]